MTSTTTAIPPLIPGSVNLASLEVSKAKIFEIFGNINDAVGSVKAVVNAASTANLTLAAPQTVDGVALVAGDLILVKDQTTASQNGIYTVAAGAWTRTADMPAGGNASGAMVFVSGGTIQAGTLWICIEQDGAAVIGTNNLTFNEISFVSPTNSGLAGTATLVAGTVTVATTAVNTGDLIFLTLNTPGGGTNGVGYSAPVASIVDGTSFVINAVSATGGALVNTDVSTVNWYIVK